VSKQKEINLKWYKRVALELLWALCRLVSVLPRWFHYYLLQPFVAGLLKLVGYRRAVITTNLQKSFPEKSESEIREIRRGYYNTLAEVIVDTISLVRVTEKRQSDFIVWENSDEISQKMKGKDWIAMAAHYGCWEYFPMWCWQDKNSYFVSVYHPLHSEVFECFYRRLRSFSENVCQVPMNEAVRFFLKNRGTGRNIVLGLVSDQSPRLTADSYWHRFLNQDTIFNEGAELLAKKFRLPIYYAYIKRLARGKYSLELVELYNGTDEVAPHEINERYARILEKQINDCPELWMWSHKRWKHTPEKQIRIFGEKCKK
jgi:KDO2-lipid IV(A) lauroyltransferase